MDFIHCADCYELVHPTYLVKINEEDFLCEECFKQFEINIQAEADIDRRQCEAERIWSEMGTW